MSSEPQDKHIWLAENLLKPIQNKARRKNLKSVSYQPFTRKTKLVLAIIGCWGVYFPPYNIARLSALSRDAGYNTTVFDFNVESYHRLKTHNLDTAWDSTNHHWWIAEYYYDKLHPTLEQYLMLYVEQILAVDSDVIGFSVYDTNKEPTEWVAKEIKKRNPNIKIIFGGPQCHAPEYIPCDEVDYWVAGEGEQIFLDFLDNVESNKSLPDRKIGKTYDMNRVDLDSLPFPDYSDYDFTKYTSSYGISAELSRGCVAKCSFCKETWFWKYRDRKANRILDEIEYQINLYGINFIWFIDSLTNGNLKELREFAIGVAQRKLNIKWMGYARCDARMDLDYYKDLAASGCNNLSYGIESGSQQVLDMMKKNIKIKDIDENLINAKKVGIFSHANWIVGAPAEDIQAMAHSLNLIWNHRSNIGALSPGVTLGDSKQTDYEFNRYRYNMSPWDNTFLGKWWSLDWSNTKIHRFIRLKYLYVWLNICNQFGTIQNCQPRPSINDDYKLEFDNVDFINHNIPYENFDHMICKPNINPFVDSVVNEIWGFARMLWRVKGGYEFEMTFDRKKDLAEFGTYISDNYDAYHHIKIDNDGNFIAKHSYKFDHDGEWWMQDNKSFTYTWTGTGTWNDNIFQIHTFDEEKVVNNNKSSIPVETPSIEVSNVKIVDKEIPKQRNTKKIFTFDF